MEKADPLQLNQAVAKTMLLISCLEQRKKVNFASPDEQQKLEADILAANSKLISLQSQCKHGQKVDTGEKTEQCIFCAAAFQKKPVVAQ